MVDDAFDLAPVDVQDADVAELAAA